MIIDAQGSLSSGLETDRVEQGSQDETLPILVLSGFSQQITPK